jgi:integrase
MNKTPRLLSPQDLREILAGTPSELKPAVAIQAFCGLRVAEMARLRWSDVLITPEGGYIQVGADNAKTSRRRLTPIPAQLVGWICKQRKADGFVYEVGKGSVDTLHRAEIALRESLSGVEWGRNALRASALSYRLAQTKDAAATALEMGNSATVLLRDYRELTTPAKAAEWFGVEL